MADAVTNSKEMNLADAVTNSKENSKNRHNYR